MSTRQDATTLSDEALVPLVLEDQEQFLHIITRYEAKLIRYIIRISGVSKEGAEDILQEVFIKVYKNLRDFDTSLSFSSWIYRITHNETISAFRKRKRRPESVHMESDKLHNFASDLDIATDTDLAFLKEHVQEIFAKMDEKYAQVLILKFLEEKSYQEISDILKKPMGTVATLINRAKKQFHKKLTQAT